MKCSTELLSNCFGFFLLLTLATSAWAAPCSLNPTNPSVTICSPAANSSGTNPVSLVAGSTDSAGVIAMAIYVDNVLIQKVNGNQISTSGSFSVGTHYMVAQLWDNAGRVIKQSENFTVANSTVPTISFSANPGNITTGQSSTLSWSTSNASSVTIDNGIGSQPASDSVAVSPSVTTTYTLTATGSGGTATAKATVSVGSSSGSCNPAGGAPSVTICSPTNGSTVPSPVHILAAPNSDTGVVAMAVYFDNALVYKANVNKVDQLINAGTGGHYIVVQYWDNNGNVPAKATANVTVGGSTPAPTINFAANPATINSGQSSTLTWTTSNATSVSIDNGIGAVATSGTHSVSPAQTTTYTLTATGADGTTSAQASVTVSATTTCSPGSTVPSVTLCSPTNGSTVASPVHVLAVPRSNTGVVAMAVYFDNTLKYEANVNQVDTLIDTSLGAHYIVVQFWDNNGAVPAKASVNITVGNA